MRGDCGKDEWWVSDLARELGVSGGKLRDWAGRGWLHARRGSAHGLWIIWADGRERDRLRKLVAHSRRGAGRLPRLDDRAELERESSDDFAASGHLGPPRRRVDDA